MKRVVLALMLLPAIADAETCGERFSRASEKIFFARETPKYPSVFIPSAVGQLNDAVKELDAIAAECEAQSEKATALATETRVRVCRAASPLLEDITTRRRAGRHGDAEKLLATLSSTADACMEVSALLARVRAQRDTLEILRGIFANHDAPIAERRAAARLELDALERAHGAIAVDEFFEYFVPLGTDRHEKRDDDAPRPRPWEQLGDFPLNPWNAKSVHPPQPETR